MDALLEKQLLGPLIMLGAFALVFAFYVIGTNGSKLGGSRSRQRPDDMDDKDKAPDTFVPYDHLTSKTRLLKSLAEGTTNRIKVLEARAVLEELTEGTVRRQR